METDPRKIWQDQHMETPKMSLDEIRRRARKLEEKGRLEAIVLIAVGLLLCPFFGWTAVRVTETIPRIGWSVLSLWCLYCVWRGYRWVWPRTAATDSPSETSLEFYRSELEKQRDLNQHLWRRSGLVWLFAGLALIIAPAIKQWAKNGVPFFVLLGIWFVSFFFIRRHKVRSLQREIDELKNVEGRIP
jgi:hypothetical protein